MVNVAVRYGAAMPEYFTFDLPNPPYKKPGWYRARWVAKREDIEQLGGRVVSFAEVREGRGSTAGHVQSSPPPSGPLPDDLAGAADLAPSTTCTGKEAGTSDSEPSGEPAEWGTLLLP